VQGALRNTQAALKAVPVLAAVAFLALAAFLGQGSPPLSLRPLAAAGVMAACSGAWHALKKFEKTFLWKDYVHADK